MNSLLTNKCQLEQKESTVSDYAISLSIIIADQESSYNFCNYLYHFDNKNDICRLRCLTDILSVLNCDFARRKLILFCARN